MFVKHVAPNRHMCLSWYVKQDLLSWQKENKVMQEGIAIVKVNNIEVGSMPISQYEEIVKSVKKTGELMWLQFSVTLDLLGE